MKKTGKQIKKQASELPDEDPKMVQDEKLMTRVLKKASEAYGKYDSQREEFEDIWEVNDYMIKCAANRDLNQTEMTKGFNPTWEKTDQHVANTGSTTVFQHWQQMAAQLIAVAFSRDTPFKYTPVYNPSVFNSEEDAKDVCNQWNTLAKWTMKHDGMIVKFIEFAHDIHRLGNVPVFFYQRRKKSNVRVRTGNPESYKYEKKRLWTENWPSFKTVDPEMLYADVLIKNIQSQDCVLLPSLVGYSEILDRVESGEYDADQVAKLTKTHLWDGTSQLEGLRKRIENNDMTYKSGDTDLFLAWDVFVRCPIKKGSWDEEGFSSSIYWLTAIGNDIGTALPVAFDPNPDPDGEIPIYMIHEMPLDNDLLYHFSKLQTVRSNYSVECTIKNQMIDNNSEVNHPPLVEIEGQVRGTDRRFRPNQVFKVDGPQSLAQMKVTDLSQHNMSLLQFVKTDSQEALHQMGNVAGEAYGGRTSATEASNAYKNAIQPHLVGTKYILWQFFNLYARKHQSYWENFAMEGQVCSITDEDTQELVNPSELYGMMDVVVDVVDEFIDDAVMEQRVYAIMNTLGTNPEAAKRIDWDEILREYFRRAKLPPSAVKGAGENVDARRVAMSESVDMIENGKVDHPEPGEDHATHMKAHRAERLKWQGIEEQSGRAGRIALLDQHIAETEALMDGETQLPSPGAPGMAGEQTPGAPAPAMGGNETVGMEAGNGMAALAGAQ
jgi:hypothetical protein